MVRTGNSQTSTFAKMMNSTIKRSTETLHSLEELNKMETIKDLFSPNPTHSKAKISNTVLEIGDYCFQIESVTPNGIYVHTDEELGYSRELVTWDKISNV